MRSEDVIMRVSNQVHRCHIERGAVATDGADVVFFRHVLHDEVHGRFVFSSSLVARSSVVVVGGVFGGVFCFRAHVSSDLVVGVLFLFFFLTADECCCEETFFLGEKWKKMGEKKPNAKKKVNAHFVNTNTIRESYRSRPFRRRHGTRERDDEGGRVRRDEDDEEEEQNAAVSTQFSDGASSVFFPLLGDVQPRDVEVRCVSLFFLSRFSLSLSFSRIFYSRRRRRTFERRE